MDNIDNLSNVSGDTSRTNLSNLSGLTGYENEINSIKYLLSNGKEPQQHYVRHNFHTKSEDLLVQEDQIRNLTQELQNCLKLNEKYKNRLFDLEHKTELLQHDKFEKLLRENSNLKVQLENANNYVERLLTKKNTDKKNNDILISDKNNYDKLQFIQSEYNNCVETNNKLKLAYESILFEHNELIVDLETKNTCVKELKRKIAEQHVQYEQLVQENILTKNKLHDVKNNLEHLIKLENWYKEQLQYFQKDKTRIYSEWSELKSLVVNKDYQIQSLAQEIEKLKLKCQNVEYNATKERDVLLHKIEMAKKEFVSIGDTVFNQNDSQTEASMYVNEIDDLNKDIELIQINMSEAYALLNESNKKKSEIIAENAILNKTLMQKNLLLDAAENKCNDLQMKLDNYVERMKKAEDELIDLKGEKSKQEIAIDLAKKEKLHVDETIKNVKEMFDKFLLVHKAIKQELSHKNKELLKLQTEKQQSFMDNNWHICEMETIKKELTDANKRNQTLVEENSKLICELYNLKSIDNNLKREMKELHENYRKLQEEKEEAAIIQTREASSKYQLERKMQEAKDEMNKIKVLLEYFTECLQCLQKSNGDNELQSLSAILSEKGITLNDANEEALSKLDQTVNSVALRLRDTSSEIKAIYHENRILQRKITATKKNLIPKMNALQLRVDGLEEIVVKSAAILQDKKSFERRTDENDAIREETIRTLSEEMKNLRALVKVKELEKKEKEKRYDVNVRTLLKKVKEHMRGRNAAEKENKVLKEMYETTLAQSSDMKLAMSNLCFEVEESRRKLANVEQINGKLRQTIIDVETNAQKNDVRAKLDAVVFELTALAEEKAAIEEELQVHVTALNRKEQTIVKLQNELQNNRLELMRQEDELNTLKQSQTNCNKRLADEERLTDELRVDNDSLSSLVDVLRSERNELRDTFDKCKLEKDDVQRENRALSEKIRLSDDELETYKSLVMAKDKVLEELKARLDGLRETARIKDLENRTFVDNLKGDVSELKLQLKSSVQENFFLKRLGDDMKHALATLSDQNKALVRRIHHSTAKGEYHSVPSDLLNLVPGPNKLDESVVNKLLTRRDADNVDRPKPLTELQNRLSSLKKEMSNLQNEIVQKSFVSFEAS